MVSLLQITDHLRSAGYNVWMDVDNLTGSTLGAMAEAVENATVVLICISESYKESLACRTGNCLGKNSIRNSKK